MIFPLKWRRSLVQSRTQSLQTSPDCQSRAPGKYQYTLKISSADSNVNRIRIRFGKATIDFTTYLFSDWNGRDVLLQSIQTSIAGRKIPWVICHWLWSGTLFCRIVSSRSHSDWLSNWLRIYLSSESTACDNTSEAGALLTQPADDKTGEGSVCKGT